MTIQTRKFSEFTDGGDLENSNTTVGLEGGVNTRFNNPWTFLPEGTTGDRPDPAPSMYYRLRFNTTLQSYEYYSSLDTDWVQLEDSGDISDLIARLAAHTLGDGASMIGLQNQSGVTNKTVQDLANATIIAQTDNGTLTNGQFMDDLANGVMYNTGGVLGADANFTTNGSGSVSIIGQLNVDNLMLDGNTLSSTNSGSGLYLQPTPTGALVTGTTSSLNDIANYIGGDGTSALYVFGSDTLDDSPIISIVALATVATLEYYVTSSDTIGVHSAVIPGEFLGIISYIADDGTNFEICARSIVYVDGFVSTGIIPTGMRWDVTDSSGVLDKAFQIDSLRNSFCFGNLSAHNFLAGYSTTITAAGTTTLTVSSNYLQYFTGSTTQIIVMPVTSTLVLGQSYKIVNNSSGALTINSSGANLILTMAANTTAEITCILTSGTTAASWNSTYINDVGVTPAALTKTDDVNVTLTLAGSPTTALLQATSLTLGWTGQLGLTRGGTAASLTASNGGIVYSGSSALAILAGTATANLILMSGSSTTPSWSTSAYPTTLGSGIATWMTTPSSANLLSAMTTKTGTGSLVFGTSPTLITPTLGAASATSINFGGSTLQTYAASTSFTPAISAGTPGDLSVSYATQTGSYAKIGQIVFIYVNLTFTPTYTTASGNLQITGFPFNADLSGYSLVINSTSSGITWPVGRTQCCIALSSGTGIGIVSCTGSAVSVANLQISGLPTGVAATINFSGWYRTATA